MIANLSFATSASLAALGIVLGVAGIAHEDFKQTATGLILILGGAVFALCMYRNAPTALRPERS